MGRVDLTGMADAGALNRAIDPRSDSEKLRAAVADLLSATIEGTAAVRLSRAATERVAKALADLARQLAEIGRAVEALGRKIDAMAETVEHHAALVEEQLERGAR